MLNAFVASLVVVTGLSVIILPMVLTKLNFSGVTTVSSQPDIASRIQTFKELGFFINLGEQEVLNKYKAENGDYVTPPEYSDLRLLKFDQSRIWWEDTEADVYNGANRYVEVLDQWSKISQGSFQPKDINEVWESDHGPITVSFKLDGQIYQITPEYYEDYLDTTVLRKINDIIKNSGYQFKQLETDDQTAFILVVATSEIDRINKQLQTPLLDP